jgi:hypothetical protein
MHWTYDDLLALPASLYPELVAYLNESAGVVDED